MRVVPGALEIAGGVALSLAVAQPAAASEVTALIDRVLAAYGGWERLSQVQGYRMEGQTLTSHDKPAAPMSRVLLRPDRLKVSLSYPNQPEVRILDGNRGLRSNAARQLVAAEGVMLDSMVLQRARADIPWILHERRSDARSCPPGRQQGVELSCVEMGLGEGLRLQAYVEPKGARVVRTICYLDRGGMNITFDNRFRDFRPVDGVTFAFREESYAGGRHTASTEIKRVVVNPKLPETEFR